MAARITSILTVLLLSGLLCAAGAVADGDPASDTLLGENVFYPYAPPVAHTAQTHLNAETAAAKRAGFPIKVALIGRPLDLGVIPDLFGKPQPYAKFLDQEISFQAKQPLLVVMAAGYGTQGLTPAATAAISGLRKPAGSTPTALALAAIPAVSHLAAASGHPIKGVPRLAGGAGSGSGSSLPLVIGLAVAALVVSAALVVLRRRRPASS
jgi:hypothetical protein